ncbi:MAG TPA: polyprenyl synthetase family protein [Chryseosolibacter sp.]|nr:polyprenyl synthetase family protein [Chryseosolibacter sp.]
MSRELQRYHNWLEKEIAVQKYGRRPSSLYDPISYLMQLGGKRLRPMLTLLSYSLFKSDVRSIVPMAVAVEAFHNFTLMHDDIMDKAPLRRGKATVHEKWNVNTAILSGDVMLVKVYDMLLRVEGSKMKTVLAAFNRCAAEVCEGQQWDMEFETNNDVTEQEYIGMIRQKTAVLLGFSLQFGAMLAGTSTANQKALKEFGTNIGIGFQLKDDLLDAYADPGKFGKQVGGDILANKKTYLLIQALHRATGGTRSALMHWLEAKKYRKGEKIEAIKRIYDSLKIPAMTEKKINHYFNKGFRTLDDVRADPTKKQMLRQYAEALIGRQQ